MASATDWNLFAKYLTHECDPTELKIMETWLSEHKDNQALLTELDIIFQSSPLHEYNEANSFQRITDRLRREGLMGQA